MKWNVWQRFCVLLLNISQILCGGAGSVRASMTGLNMRRSHTGETSEADEEAVLFKLIVASLMSTGVKSSEQTAALHSYFENPLFLFDACKDSKSCLNSLNFIAVVKCLKETFPSLD